MSDENPTNGLPSPLPPPTATPAPSEMTESDLVVSRAAVAIREILSPEDQRLTYHITLPAFDGPMDLLLHLIKEHELDIYDIPIHKITKEYLAYLELMRALNLEVAGDFLVMAATLMQIKSRMLLPVEPSKEQEEEDPRAELVRRLLEYKMFKEAAERLSGLEKEHGRLLTRSVPDEAKGAEEEHLVEVTLFGLLSAFKDVLIQTQEGMTAELVRPEITVTQKINDIMDRLQEGGEALFKPLIAACGSKLERIVAFLAVLELVRLKLVRAFQRDPFDEIRLTLAAAPETTERQETTVVRKRRKKA
jgi:segregation and condensation protein A